MSLIRTERVGQDWPAPTAGTTAAGSEAGTTTLTASPAGPTSVAPEEIVRTTDLQCRFGTTAALDGVSISVRRGEILGIIGRSGAGKSTLIRCLNGLTRPTGGSVVIEGREIATLSERQLQPVRARIGMIFQHFNLLAAKTVEDNVALPLKIAGVGRDKRRRRARELLDLVGLASKARDYPAMLSGGQKQRVGIARALVAEPSLLLSDEATSALDPESTRSILSLLRDINREFGLSIVLITHEMDVIRKVADRVAVIDHGRIIESGEVWEVFARPRSSVAREMLEDLRPQLPEDVAQRLTDRAESGGQTILKLGLDGAATQGPLLSELLAGTFGRCRLIQGGVDHIQGHPIARCFVAIDAADQAGLVRLVEAVGAENGTIEVLGHVADHD